MSTDFSAAKNELKENRIRLLEKANVVATGIGYKFTNGEKTPTPSIICSVVEKLPLSKLSSSDRIPKTISGAPTDIVQTGVIRAFASRTTRHRPAPAGVSIGHRDITAGTFGCLVKKDGQTYILSNNHVLANSNDANVGDPILQPGSHDGGKMPDDHIANLSEYVPISFTGGIPGGGEGCSIANGTASFLNGLASIIGSKWRLQTVNIQPTDNLVDAAIARPLTDNDVSSEIMEIGEIAGMGRGELAMAIQKSGRTTGYTTGEIMQTDVTVNVQYGAGRIARFTDQLMAGAMSQGGDSGSAVLDMDKNLVGLLYAGSDTSTIINNIDNVFSALGLSL